MKKIFFLIIKIIAFIIIFTFFSNKILAASLTFDKNNLTISSGQSFNFQINIDAGSDEVRSADIYISYDSNYLQIESVNEGSYFSTVISNTSTTGLLYIASMNEDPAVTKTGSGTIATVNFKAIKDGSTTISLDCSTSKVIKADIDASNILVCNQAPRISVSIGNERENLTPTSLPRSLPKTGVFDNLEKAAKPAILFLIFGTVLRIIL